MKKWLVLLIVFGLFPRAAHAHLVTTGFGGFYDGLAHFLITPVDLLAVISLGLLAGLTGAAASRGALVWLAPAWLIGGLVGMWAVSGGSWPLATTLSFGLVGLLVALDRRLPQQFVVVSACLVGLLHGYVNGATMASANMDWLALTGATVAVFVLVTILSAVVVSLRVPWQRIVVRVGGSWIAAIGILMVGWSLRAVWR